MRLHTLLLAAAIGVCTGVSAFAQVGDTQAPPNTAVPGPNPLVTLASEFFDHDYFNVYAFGDGILDTNNPTLNAAGQTVNTLGTGFDLGGGLNLYHQWRGAQLSVSYSGAYRQYQNANYDNGTTQSLSVAYNQRLSRHLSMNVFLGAGEFLYGQTFLTGTASEGAVVASNPFSPITRYASGGVALTYQQTRRLSYSVTGNIFLNRYNFPGAIGTTGLAGSGSVNYRVTARDTISASYAHSYFAYQRNAGNASADQVGGTWTHSFRNRLSVSVFGGEARSYATGTVTVPVTLIIDNQAVGGYVTGTYRQTAYLPSYSGTVSRYFRRSALSVSAGEGIAGSGNGYFLASKSEYINGLYSYSWRHQNFSASGSWFRISSISNTVSSKYDTALFNASYGRNLMRFFGIFLRYSYVRYGALAPLSATHDNQIAFGFNFSSRSVPLTLF